MEHLDASQLALLREQLEQERDLIRERVGRPEHANDTGDVQDRAAEDARIERELRQGHHERCRLAEIDAALMRMREGDYGICEETGEPIPFARLRSEPTTRYTVEALEDLEREQARDRTSSGGDDDDDGQQPY
ncbi:MAG: TraR/DksA family transcriptional regulator [Deltaproteobacteria bacterium]|nr:TraR/DksA family transcriptional regulator [Deltaproteobacteria bacterium]